MKTKALSLILSAIMLLSLTAAFPAGITASAELEDINVPNPFNWSFGTLDGGTVTCDTYAGQLQILIFFKADGTCPNSLGTIKALSRINLSLYEGVKVIAVGCGVGSESAETVKAEIQENYGDYLSDKVVFCYAAADELWEAIGAYHGAAGKNIYSLTFCENIVIDKSGNLRYLWNGPWDIESFSDAVELGGDWDEGIFYAGSNLITTDRGVSGSRVIREGTKSINESAFYNRLYLTGVTVPESVVKIDSYAFAYCYNLSNVYIKSPTVAKLLTDSWSAGSLIENAGTVILSEGIAATDYIKGAYPFTGTAVIGGENVVWYKKTEECAVHFYESEGDADCNICGKIGREEQPVLPGSTTLGIEGKYITQIEEALNRINEIRLEACTEGVANPETGAPLTLADYTPLKWSADLEYIARIRAAEASITMDHARTNGESIWFTGPGGIQSYAEVLAWNYGETMTEGVNQWYAEKSDWVNKTGGVTGHYTSMIAPRFRYVGLAAFCSNTAKYYNTTAGEFSPAATVPDTSRGEPTEVFVQMLEFDSKNVSYEISCPDTISASESISVTAAVSFTDYWSAPIETKGLVLPESTANEIQWSTSDAGVFTVSGGQIIPVSCGTSTVTASLPNGIKVTKQVTVEHSYTVSAWESDGAKHWHLCRLCGETLDEAEHVYDNACDEDCNVCGATREVTHSPGGWESYGDKHRRVCTVCGKTLDSADHVFDDGLDASCNVCGYLRTVTAVGDANGDGAVNNVDASLVLQIDAGIIGPDDSTLRTADVNGDGSVNNLDASNILRFDSGIIPHF